MDKFKTLSSSKFLAENIIYQSGIGASISSVKATQVLILAFNEGIDSCISELETGENNVEIERLRKLKM